MAKRRRHSSELKARVAMEAIAGLNTASEIAAAYEVHPSQVAQWKRELLEGAPGLFDRKADKRRERDAEAVEQRHHAKIGQLTLEVDWLKKKCRQLQIPLDGER
jgi:transposase